MTGRTFTNVQALSYWEEMGSVGTYKTSDRLVPGKLQKKVEVLDVALASCIVKKTTNDMRQGVTSGQPGLGTAHAGYRYHTVETGFVKQWARCLQE